MPLADKLAELKKIASEKIEGEIYAPPASEEDIGKILSETGLEPNEEIRALYHFCNGTVFPDGATGNNFINGYWIPSVSEMIEDWKIAVRETKRPGTRELDEGIVTDGKVKPYWYNPKWLPVMRTDDGCMAIDYDPDANGHAGQLIEFYFDDDERRVVADSLENYFNNFLLSIASGEIVYEPDAGGFYDIDTF